MERTINALASIAGPALCLAAFLVMPNPFTLLMLITAASVALLGLADAAG